MSSYKRKPISIFGPQPTPEGRIGKKSERKDILSRLGEEACMQTPTRSLYRWMADGYLSTTDLCNLCYMSKQDHADISRAIFAIIHLPLDGIWSHEHGKGRLSLFLEAVWKNMGRGVWADDMIKEIVIHDKKIPPMSTLQKKSYVRVMAMLLRVMESLTSLRVFRWDSQVPMSTSVFAVLSLHTPRLTECQFRMDSSAYQDLNSDGCILFDTIKDPDSEIPKPTESGDYPVPNDKRLGTKSTIVLQNATPRAIISLSKIISMHFYLIHKVDIIGPGGKTLRRDRFRELQFEGGNTSMAIKVSHLRLVNINSAAGHFTKALDPKFLRDIQLDRCIQLPDIFSPLMQAKTAVEGLGVIFPPYQHDDGPVISTVEDVKGDQKAVSDLLRSTAMQLQHLTIGQSSYGSLSQTDLLLAGIQPHFANLQELCLSDLEPKFELSDLREIALCATWLRDLRIPLSKDILQSFIEILPEFRSLQVFAILDAEFTIPERHATILIIQQACQHTPLCIIGIEDKKAGNWHFCLNRSPHKKNEPLPLNEAPTAKAINCCKDIGDFQAKINHWAIQLGIPVHGEDVTRHRSKRWGNFESSDHKLLGTEVKNLSRPTFSVEPWLVELYDKGDASGMDSPALI